VCAAVGHEPFTDATFEVELPDNPVLPDGIAVTTNYVDCSDTHLPNSGPVRCTQNEKPDKEGGLPDVPPLPSPSDQGVSR
jgi:hypothetical protein